MQQLLVPVAVNRITLSLCTSNSTFIWQSHRKTAFSDMNKNSTSPPPRLVHLKLWCLQLIAPHTLSATTKEAAKRVWKPLETIYVPHSEQPKTERERESERGWKPQQTFGSVTYWPEIFQMLMQNQSIAMPPFLVLTMSPSLHVQRCSSCGLLLVFQQVLRLMTARKTLIAALPFRHFGRAAESCHQRLWGFSNPSSEWDHCPLSFFDRSP